MIEGTIRELLGPLVEGRVHPDVTPDVPVFPLIIYQQVGGRAIDYADQTLPDHEHARMQVTVWSRSRLEANDLTRQARAILLGSPMTVQTYGAPVWLMNEAQKLYGSRTDYGIWYIP